VPLAATQPNVQPDQILASLDADTRDFLRLLLSGGARGVGGHGEELSAGLRRLEPTVRDLARVNGALAKRRANLRRVVHNFGLLSAELARHDRELADFVSSSDDVFRSFARQQQALRDAVRQLPSTLESTHRALASSDELALVLEPAARSLVPSARALGPALREVRPFLRSTTRPIREQIRPFTRQVARPVDHIADASRPLAQTSEDLAPAVTALNQALNILSYDPPGGQQSFLYFLSWLGHNTNSLFLTQDAHGPLLRGLVLQSCGTAIFAEGIAANIPFLRTLQQLTNVPTSDQIEAADSGAC
jgi:phospholipid/cholesterol/gamma-HCH transport system substrate-binding protein